MEIKRAPLEAIQKNLLCRFKKIKISVVHERINGEKVTSYDAIPWPKNVDKFSKITQADADLLNSHKDESKIVYDFIEVLQKPKEVKLAPDNVADEAPKRGRKKSEDKSEEPKGE